MCKKCIKPNIKYVNCSNYLKVIIQKLENILNVFCLSFVFPARKRFSARIFILILASMKGCCEVSESLSIYFKFIFNKTFQTQNS